LQAVDQTFDAESRLSKTGEAQNRAKPARRKIELSASPRHGNNVAAGLEKTLN
jgi:hypothetical protein